MHSLLLSTMVSLLCKVTDTHDHFLWKSYVFRATEQISDLNEGESSKLVKNLKPSHSVFHCVLKN